MTGTTAPRNRIRIEEITANPAGDPAGDFAYLRVNDAGRIPVVGETLAIRTDDDPDYAVIRVRVTADLGGEGGVHHLPCEVIGRTPRVDTEGDEHEYTTVRPTFLVPTADLVAFRSGDVERVAGIAIDRLTKIAALGGERSKAELALVEAYSEIASNAAPSMSSAELDHFWEGVGDVEDISVGYEPSRPAPARSVRRSISDEKR